MAERGFHTPRWGYNNLQDLILPASNLGHEMNRIAPISHLLEKSIFLSDQKIPLVSVSLNMKLFLAACALSTSLLSAAHPGKAPYELYCGACHSPDGKGINVGQFPPLAGSEWVDGKSERLIEIVLHGLEGPLQVDGKDYNLVMPPHKDSLTDQQIADIISYVRSSWGHKESPVSVEQVIAMRKATAKKKDMWKAPQLLKKYPITRVGPLKDLLSYTHHGSFKTVEELRKSKRVNTEEEKGGLISLTQAALKDTTRDAYGLTWEGWLEVPKDGKYTFHYDTDDGGAVTVNGKQIISRNYVGPAGKPTKKAINLKKGRAEIKIEYFELAGQEFISLAWEGPGLKLQALSDTAPSKGDRGGGNPEIMLTAPAGEALIYRNFIEGTDPRAIGVGYSDGVNLAFSGDSMSLDMLWSGNFMDAERHWTNRGQGNQPPAGDQLVKVNRGLAFAMLESQTSPWPSTADDKLKPVFKGYDLDQKQHPTFRYHFGPVDITDKPTPSADGSGFTRTIVIDVPSPGSSGEQLYFRALSGGAIAPAGERTFTFNSTLNVNVANSENPPFTRDNELIVPIPLTPGKHEITLDYSWN